MTALKYDVAAGETKDRRVDVLAFGVRTYVRRFALKDTAAGQEGPAAAAIAGAEDP
jgi:hypothetical protein